MRQVEVAWDCGCTSMRRLHIPSIKSYRRHGGIITVNSVVFGLEAVHMLFCPEITVKPRRKLMTQKCAHCGRVCGDAEGGWGSLNGEPLCNPNVKGRPDCYHLVTVYHHPLGHEDCPVTDGVEGAACKMADDMVDEILGITLADVEDVLAGEIDVEAKLAELKDRAAEVEFQESPYGQ
jgi:hypothetical protein